MRTFFLASYTLWHREVVRFLRQKSRVVGALLPPILFWFLIGSGLGESFHVQASEFNYLQYFFPGTIMLIVLFTAIFSTISVIEDRHEGFLQSVLVAPLSRLTLVLGKLLGGSTLAMGQALLFLLLAPLAGIHVHLASVPILLAHLLMLSFGLTGLGFALAWALDSTQGFHAIMNLFLIPMWLLSGALFPMEGASPWIQWIMRLNPLSYGLSVLQHHLYFQNSSLGPGMAPDGVSFLVWLTFSLVMLAASVWSVERRSW